MLTPWGKRIPWDVSVSKVYQDRQEPSPILYYSLALFQARTMASNSPILRRHRDLAGNIPRPGGRAAVMDRRSARCGLLRRGTRCYTACSCVCSYMTRFLAGTRIPNHTGNGQYTSACTLNTQDGLIPSSIEKRLRLQNPMTSSSHHGPLWFSGLCATQNV